MAGYIGSQTPVVSNGSQRKYTFTATAAQTVFTGMDIPNPQQIQVFQNGVRLVITTDYTVSSGTTVTLVNAASAGDSLVVILFADYQLLDQDLSGDFSVDSPTFVVDSTNNRVGIGNAAPTQALDVTGDIVTSGGVYLGGTGAANYLDDYEEGTWTPVFSDANTGGNTSATTADYANYTKIGNVVHVWFRTSNINTTGMTGVTNLVLQGLPFASKQTTNGTVHVQSTTITGLYVLCRTTPSSTFMLFNEIRSGTTDVNFLVNDLTSGSADIEVNLTYEIA
jgi:hypothetical protein